MKSETTVQNTSSRTPAFEQLEPRLLLSADLIGVEPLAPLGAGVSPEVTVVDSPTTIAAAGGMVQFEPEQHVPAGGTDIQVTGYSVPVLADWNADGRPDLLVGEKFDTVSGKVRVYLNNGTAAAPIYGSFSYVQAAGSDLAVPATGCLGAYPRVHDWNQDGRQDLLIGLADGTIRLYLNTGTAANPSFNGSSTIQAGDPGAKVNIDVGDRAAFDIVDWNERRRRGSGCRGPGRQGPCVPEPPDDRRAGPRFADRRAGRQRRSIGSFRAIQCRCPRSQRGWSQGPHYSATRMPR